ncbi:MULTISPECIES: molybdopterin cofactor-binding domain-containing protein [unclassified Streptomyces]|uniref:molybdopterin cofactor-binding domain-containing protein n=1 Tax=unclassified Streptomyces TaxID=2593676 RepID=UPI0032D57F62
MGTGEVVVVLGDDVKAGARRDGTLTALELRVVSNTGAYGNHGPAVMFHACGESLSVYRCPNKKADGYAVYTHTVPAGAFRGYGLGQVVFAMESVLDELPAASASIRSCCASATSSAPASR